MSNAKDSPSSLLTTLVGNVMNNLMDRSMPNDIMKQFTFDQLSPQIENASKGGNLSPSETNDLWKQFYVVRFGGESANLLVEKTKKDDVPIDWKQIYNEKSKEEGPPNPPLINKTDQKKSKKRQKLVKLSRGFKKPFILLKKLTGQIIGGIGKVIGVVVGTISMLVFTVVFGVVTILIGLTALMFSACLCCPNCTGIQYTITRT